MQIVQARAMLLQDLRSTKTNIDMSSATSLTSVKEGEQHEPAVREEGKVSVVPVSAIISSESLPSTSPQAEDIFVSIPVVDVETEKHPVESTEVKIIDKSVVIEEDPPVQSKTKDLQADVSSVLKQKDVNYEDDWLEDETGEASGSVENSVPLGNDEDVSFSDLEEDDEHGAQTKAIFESTPTQVKESRGWVQLNKNPGIPVKRTNSASPQNKDDWLNVDEVDSE